MPEDASDVRFLYYKPASELRIYSAYLKFDCPIGEYERFAAMLDLKTDTERLTPHLPAAWGLPPGLAIDWWDAAVDTPDNARAKSLDDDGWIVAKHEQNYVYLIAAGNT